MSSKSGNGSKKDVVLTRCPVGNATEIALKKGWLTEEFSQRGADFRLLQSLSRKHWVKHFTQESPLSFREGGNIPPIWAKANGIETRLIGLTFLPQTQAIIARPNSSIGSVGDLKGKRLALPRRVNDEVDFWWATVKHGFVTALEAHGLGESDVEFVELTVEKSYLADRAHSGENAVFAHNRSGRDFQKVEIDALVEGKVDAIYSAGGRAIEIERSGVGRILFDFTTHSDIELTNNLYPNVVTVGEEFAADHPDLVRLYLEQLIRAAIWAEDNREEVIGIFARGTYVSEEAVVASRPDDFHKHLVPEITNEGIVALESQKKFLLSQGFIRNDFNVQSWVDKSFLRSALGAVTV